MGLKFGERALLICAHETRVASHIGGEDGSQPPFNTRVGHIRNYTNFTSSVGSGARRVYPGRCPKRGMHVGLAALQPFGQQKSRSSGLGGLKAQPLERNSDARTYAGSSRTPIIIVSYNGPHKVTGAIGENNPIAEQRVFEEPTMWWFVALPFLLGLSVLDIIAKSTGGPRQHRHFHPHRSHRSSNLHSVDGTLCVVVGVG